MTFKMPQGGSKNDTRSYEIYFCKNIFGALNIILSIIRLVM